MMKSDEPRSSKFTWDDIEQGRVVFVHKSAREASTGRSKTRAMSDDGMVEWAYIQYYRRNVPPQEIPEREFFVREETLYQRWWNRCVTMRAQSLEKKLPSNRSSATLATQSRLV